MHCRGWKEEEHLGSESLTSAELKHRRGSCRGSESVCPHSCEQQHFGPYAHVFVSLPGGEYLNESCKCDTIYCMKSNVDVFSLLLGQEGGVIRTGVLKRFILFLSNTAGSKVIKKPTNRFQSILVAPPT